MKRLFAILVGAVLAVWTPVAQTATKVYKYSIDEVTALASAYLPWLIPAGWLQDAPADPGLPPGEVFINGMLVLGSSVGMVQSSSSLNKIGGLAYDTRNYLRITLSPPSTQRIRGWAVDSNGAVHVYDATFGLPADVRWQDGLPVTPTGQLCVAFG